MFEKACHAAIGKLRDDIQAAGTYRQTAEPAKILRRPAAQSRELSTPTGAAAMLTAL